jgi:hypothetical protein
MSASNIPSNMSASDIPTIKVLITPEYDAAHRVEDLLIDLTLPAHQVHQLPEYSDLVSFTESLDTASDSADEDGVAQLFDMLGQLLILAQSRCGNSNLEMVEAKSTSEYMRLIYRAFPLTTRETDLGAPAADLRLDHGGLLGSGLAFIPFSTTSETCRSIVQWDLSKAPPGTRAVWTFGEGPDPVEIVGHSSILSESVYMVGKIQSNPPEATPWTLPAYYGYYWFGELPPNIKVIRDIHYQFFVKVSDFFKDPPSASKPYRSFVRNNGRLHNFGGSGFTRSHIFDYDDLITKADDYDLVRRMSQEMVHNWLGPSPTDETIDWLYEGISNTLSIYLPFRTGIRDGDYFSSTLTMLCMRYYTNPFLTIPLGDLITHAPVNEYAREMLIARAWAFVIGTDFRARKVSELKRPIEDLAIKPLSKKRANGEAHGIWEWLDLLQPLLGNGARDLYESMHKGTVILLPVEVFGAPTHYLQSIRQEILDFGMDRESFEDGVVTELRKGTRAEEAGLREGDKILWYSPPWKCVDDFQARMELFVESGGVEKRVTYWPRAFDKAESWQMVKVKTEGS